MKHDLRLKSRLVAEGNLTAPPKDSVYSGAVTLRSLRLCMLLAELNGLKVEAADVGNARLKAYTKEKFDVVAGPEFGYQKGNVMVILKRHSMAFVPVERGFMRNSQILSSP